MLASPTLVLAHSGMNPDTSTTLPIVTLNKYEIRRIRSGHPWIYSKSIESLPDRIKSGDAVTVIGPRSEKIGTAIYNEHSKIKLRVVAPQIHQLIDTQFFETRIREALNYRKTVLPGRSCYRLLNSESDGLSGLIIDCYEGATLFQITSLGIETRKPQLIEAIQSVLKPTILIERNDVSNRKFEGLEPILKVHQDGGFSEDRLSDFEINIEGIRYKLNLIEGNKTGLYLDQIDNHLKLQKQLECYTDAKVLDCFSYIGGFSMSAALSRHTSTVLGLDQSSECISKAIENAKINSVIEKCTFEKANVFDWLREASEVESELESYDVIILDPPSFTKNRHTVEGALRGYKELHVRALKLLKKGGRLLTYSCSHHISEDMLRSIVFEASNDTQSQLVEIESHRQSLDHPIVPHIPESYYLKGFVYLKR